MTDLVLPGFFGKVPTEPDFVSCRMPKTFVDPWRTWIERAIPGRVFAEAPPGAGAGARFALAKGICGEQAWMGVIIPSRDSLGNPFPLVVAAPIQRALSLVRTLGSENDWFGRVEEWLASQLSAPFDLVAFDNGLLDLELTLPASAGGEATFGLDGIRSLDLNIPAAARTATNADWLLTLGEFLLNDRFGRYTLWMKRDVQGQSATVQVFHELPPRKHLLELLSPHASTNLHTAPTVVGFASPEPAPEASPESAWQSFGLSVVGQKRKLNEDSLLDNPVGGLWVVADGMGGHQGGDVASRAIVDSLAGLKGYEQIEPLADAVKATLQEVNTMLCELAGGGDRIIGSTVVALLAVGERCACIWAGDSRLYRFRDDELEQLSRDHSLLDDLSRNGLMTQEELAAQGHCNVITRAVGADTRLDLDCRWFDAKPGDMYVLCSDGLDKELTPDEIAAHVRDGSEPRRITNTLIDQAEERGARDNVTVLVVEYRGGSAH